MKTSTVVFCEILYSIEMPKERDKSLFNTFITQDSIYKAHLFRAAVKQSSESGKLSSLRNTYLARVFE